MEGMTWDPDTWSLNYEFWSAQQRALAEFLAGDHDITAFLGGYGSGKTTCGARLILSLAFQHPGSKHAVISIDYKKGSQTTYETLFKNLPGERTHVLTSSHNGPETSPIVEDYNRNDKRITLVNDSMIRLGSAENPDDVIGDEFMSVWMDEPSKYHPNDKLYDLALETVPTRMRAHDPQYGQFWSLTGNGYNTTYEILKERTDADGNDIKHDIHVEYASVLENPYLDPNVRKRFWRQYAETEKAEQALYGGFSTTEGLVYDADRGRHIVTADSFGDTLPPLSSSYAVYGFDAGWVDPQVILDIRKTVGDDRLVVWDEYYESEEHISDATNWMGTPEEDRPAGVVACEHEPSDVDKIEKSGWSTVKANKDLEAGISEVSDWLNPKDEETGERLPPRLMITERCENTIKELHTYKQGDVGSAGATDHAMDALRYAVMAVADGEDSGMGFATVSTR